MGSNPATVWSTATAKLGPAELFVYGASAFRRNFGARPDGCLPAWRISQFPAKMSRDTYLKSSGSAGADVRSKAAGAVVSAARLTC